MEEYTLNFTEEWERKDDWEYQGCSEKCWNCDAKEQCNDITVSYNGDVEDLAFDVEKHLNKLYKYIEELEKELKELKKGE